MLFHCSSGHFHSPKDERVGDDYQRAWNDVTEDKEGHDVEFGFSG